MTRAKILCLGDLHLGVHPSRVPADAAPAAVSVATIWRRAVETALREGVGLVLLSGDVVDRANRYFEAFGPLEEGLARLAEAGVEVCAVAGNHDFDVLPRLAASAGSERFHLLGRGGRWERFTWRRGDGRALVHVDGWSFPARDVTDDPVASYDLKRPGDEAPVLGLLHGELDREDSTNAPLTRVGLERPEVDAWVLGHLHGPRVIDLAGGRWALYPGSPQPLDPTEEGAHGGWTVDLDGARPGRPELLALATVRWECLELDLGGAADSEGAEGRIARAVRETATALEEEGPDVDWLCLRLVLSGRTAAHRNLPELARRLEEETPLEVTTRTGRARVVEVACATRPAPDLGALAEGEDPVALLASLLLDVDPELDPGLAADPDPGGRGSGPPGAYRDLLAGVQDRLGDVYDQRAYLPLGGRSELDGEAVRRHAAAGAADLLDALLVGKDGPARGTGEDA